VYKSLQGSRAVAAMMVVLYHLGLAISSEKYFGIEAFASPFSFGHAGVPFFFILSGFIIFSAHRNDISRPEMLASYLKKRIIRIYPTYWIIFLSVFLVAIFSSSLRYTVPQDAYVIFKSLLLIPHENKIDVGNTAPVLSVAWTLQYEVIFYILFGFFILNRWLPLFVAVLVCGLYYSSYADALSKIFFISFLTKDVMLLFFMGMVVSAAAIVIKTVNNPLFYLNTGIFIFMFLAVNSVVGINLEMETMLYGLASCLIVFGLVRSEDKCLVYLGQPLMQKLGDSSYALYLIHYPLISILCKLALLAHLNSLGVMGAIISFILIFAACLSSSLLFHQWVEKPIAAYLRKY
jgi:peptidoglycan/LPS O-acetylase OafA/YrhL